MKSQQCSKLPSNLSPTVCQGLNSLRRRTDVVIKIADKNLGLVAVDTEWYRSQALAHLSATCLIDGEVQPAYQLITESTAPDIIQNLSAVLTAILLFHNKVFSKKLVEFISTIPAPCKPGRFYLTVKVHKTPYASRPICSTIPWITTNAAAWLDHKLQPLLKAEPTCLLSSLELLKIIDRRTFPNATFLATFDVISLYPSIAIGNALEKLTVRFGPGSAREVPEWPAILDLLQFVLYNNYFEFDGQLYKQLQGVAMGVIMAVSFSSLFMVTVEEPIIQAAANQIELYKRFIDDGFIVWSGTRQSLVDFFDSLGQVDPNIKLTFDISPTSAIFLDLSLSLQADGVLSTSLYQKPMNLYPYIPFLSAHRAAIKRAFILSELNRYIISCSQIGSYNALKALFYQRLRARGYPPSFLAPLFTNHSYNSRSERLCAALSDTAKNKEKITPFVIRDSPNARNIDWHSILSTPVSIRQDSDLASVLPRPLPAFSNPPSLRYRLERMAHEPRL